MEGDFHRRLLHSKSAEISIHALRVEGDQLLLCLFHAVRQFLSTPSGWRATCGGDHAEMEGTIFLSTPSGWRATCFAAAAGRGRRISIHALRVEGDDVLSGDKNQRFVISIHALRVEGDGWQSSWRSVCQNFYPRPPGGGRRTPIKLFREVDDFYPRPPGGGRQNVELGKQYDKQISIHALRVEGDSKNGQRFRLFLRKREKNLPL